MPLAEPSQEILAQENSELRRHIEELEQRNNDLHQQNAELHQEKADLELLIETNIEHSDLVADELFSQLDSARTLLLTKITRLHQEIDTLQQEIVHLQKERVDLELLLEMNTSHSDSVEEELLNRVESTLRESERRFRLISETIPVPITVSRTADHSIVYANEPASNLFGVALSTLHQFKIIDFYPPDVQQRLIRLFTTKEHVNNYDLQGYKCDGTIFYGMLYARPLNFNEEPCLLCAIYDLTERKHAEDEIRMLNEELEARVQRRTQELEHAHARIVKLEKEAIEVQMAGGFAHEMRNALVGAKLMLASVIENNETLCQKNVDILGHLYDSIAPHLPPFMKNHALNELGTIEQNEELLDNMLRLVNYSIISALGVTTLILEYSRLGRATAGNDKVHLSDVIRRIIQEHQVAFASQGITFHSELQETTWLLGHESHFHSIINNIVLNARDELITTNANRERRIDIMLYQEKDQVIVTITDNAHGIPEDALSKIFEPFFSTKPTTGTGLGLSFVSKLVPLYHGNIEVKSRMNEGTTFLLTFPVQEPDLKGERCKIE